jgi:hypothetical protein
MQKEKTRSGYAEVSFFLFFFLHFIHHRGKPGFAHLPEGKGSTGPDNIISVIKSPGEGLDRGFSDPAESKRQKSPQLPVIACHRVD